MRRRSRSSTGRFRSIFDLDLRTERIWISAEVVDYAKFVWNHSRYGSAYKMLWFTYGFRYHRLR